MTDEYFEINCDPKIAELLARFAGSTLDLATALTITERHQQERRRQEHRAVDKRLTNIL